MRNPRAPLVLLLSGLAVASCRTKPVVNPKLEEQTISALERGWNDLLRTRNDSGIAELYAEDAVVLPPNMPRVVGRENIRKFWAGLWPLNASLTLALTSVTVAQSGDLAVDEGNWVFELPTPQGAQRDNGKYVVVWTKVGGKWKVQRDIYNSDNPPPAPPPAKPR